MNGRPIAYLDNAATTQKPRQVIAAIQDVYSSGIANVHRAVNFLADEVTRAFEDSRGKVAQFIGAQPHEIIFLSNATHGLNVVANSLGRQSLRVLTTTLEHHSNLLPWSHHGTVDFTPWSPDGQIDLEAFRRKLKEKWDLVTISRVSNFLGVVQPVHEIIGRCREAGIPVLLDASQSIAHQPHDVRELGCDYMVFSGHKVYGPGGTGVLYVSSERMDQLTPMLLGGSMVKEVHADGYVPNDMPHRFEAGTPNIEGVIGLAAALDYVLTLGFDAIAPYECALVQHAKRSLRKLRGITIFGPEPGEPCGPLVTFQVKALEASAVAKALANRSNVIVRSGFHCAQPAHDRLGLGPTVRASFAVYNTKEEIDCMVNTIDSLTAVLN
jgi:cysteine desulfurase/selenocysteine lyase